MSEELEALKVWKAVEKYMNLYHHQAVKDDINVETVEGMPIKIIEKSLEALDIIKKVLNFKIRDYSEFSYGSIFISEQRIILDDEEIDLLKEILL